MAGNLGLGPVASASVAGGSGPVVASPISSSVNVSGNLGFGAVSSAAIAGSTSSVSSSGNVAGNLGFGAVASGAVAGGGVSGVVSPFFASAGNLGFGAIASTAVAGNQSPGTILAPVSNAAVVARASARVAAAASFIAAAEGGPVRASQVVMEVLVPFAGGAKLRPFVWINT